MERGDFSRADWAHPEIESVMVGGPEPGSGSRLTAMATGWGEVLGAWENFRVELDDCREVDDERVLALINFRGRGKTSGLEIATKGAALFQLRDGMVSRIVHYWNRDHALADLGLEETVSQESTTPDPVGAIRASVEAVNRRDFGTALAIYTPDSVWDTSAIGLGVYEGREVMREFFEGWVGAYEDWAADLEEVRDLGAGVVFYVLRHRGRPAGGSALVELRHSYTAIALDGLFTRVTVHADIDQARAAAERLAEERR
jgi:ketosteroid isomerase-like protein